MKRISSSRIMFNIINFLLLMTIVLSILLPFFHVVSISLSSKEYIIKKAVTFWPKGFEISAYKNMITKPLFISAFINSVLVTACYTFFFVLINLMAGFAFTKKFIFKKVLIYYFLIPMYFSGGLIPTYILVTQYLKWYNTYFALIIGQFFSFFYMVIIRSQIEAIPSELSESARIDGAGEFSVLFKIILPTVKGTIAAVAMFAVLGKWNSWFDVMIYTNKNSMWNLQYFLRTIIMDKTMLKDILVSDMLTNADTNITSENYKMAAIMLVSLPIISVYPFVQKYFVKGLLVGAVKG